MPPACPRFAPRLLLLLALGLTLDPGFAQANAAKAWQEIQSLQQRCAEAAAASRPDPQLLGGNYTLLQTQLENFLRDHPRDKNSWRARLLLPETRVRAARAFGFPVEWSEADRELDALIADPALPARDRADAAFARISLDLFRASETSPKAATLRPTWDRMEAFAQDHPKHPAAARVQLALGRQVFPHDSARAERAFTFASRSADPKVAHDAQRELAVLPYRSTPLDLSFVATDGRPVDLAALRGKVVLIDFWATWCGPCIRELPKVVAAYQKYHAAGLEIVGISLDEDRRALDRFVAQRQLPWPQYYDGRGWDNRISRRFHISSIPEMWLLDRDGRIVSTEIWGGNLDYHVARLLGR